MRFSEIIDRLNKKDARCKFELGSSKSFRLNNVKGFSDWISIDLEKLNTDKEFYSGVPYNKVRQISIITAYDGEKYNNSNLLDFVNEIIPNDNIYWKIEYEYKDNKQVSFSVNDVENVYEKVSIGTYTHKLEYDSDGELSFYTPTNKAKVYIDDVYDVKSLDNGILACPICRKSKTDCSDCEFKQKSELVKTLEYLGL